MVIGVDGFDYGDAGFLGRKYLTQGFLQATVFEGRQPSNRVGGGYHFHPFNSGFDLHWKSKTYGAMSKWVVGLAAYIDGYCDTDPGYFFLRFADGPASNVDNSNPFTQLSIGYSTAGHLVFFSGGEGWRSWSRAGDLVSTSTWTWPLHQWVYLEFEITFGGGGHIKVFADDVLVHEDSGFTIGHAGAVNDPDRLEMILQNLGTVGVHYDDMIVATERIGPVRVSTCFPTRPGVSQWARNTAAANYMAVDDPGGFTWAGKPIGIDDAATELTGAFGQVDLYGFDLVPCFGLVIAVAANAMAHGATGASALDLIIQPTNDTASRYDIAAGLVVPAAYQGGAPLQPSVVQGVVNTPTTNGGIWRAGDIKRALWGMRAGGDVLATQYFLEQVVSLRAVPYDCGAGGSYAY